MLRFMFMALTVSLSVNAVASVGNGEFTPDQTRLRQAFEQDEKNTALLRQAPQLAKDQGRELHIVLGAAPGELHIQRLLALENQKESESKGAFKSPVRIFFTKDEGFANQKDSTERTPIFFGDFNGVFEWDILVGYIYPAGKKLKFTGPVDKIYFDWSVVKFVRWDSIHMIRLVSLLKPEGMLFLPDVNLSSQASFCESKMTISESRTLIDQNTQESRAILNSRPYPTGLAPKLKESCFAWGISCSAVEKRGDAQYTYNTVSLVYDTNFTGQMSTRNKQFVGGPLQFLAFQTSQGYPDMGAQLRDQGGVPQGFFDAKSYVAVSKGK